MTSRYIIGIDLGTTNTVVAFLDTNQEKNPFSKVQIFKIPQLVDIGKVEALPVLPSFYYIASKEEFPPKALDLPWTKGSKNSYIVGFLAKEHGAKVPTRLVQSAKSWLSNAGAARKEKILPLEAAEVNRKISPVEASSSFLQHIKDAWNENIAKGRLEDAFEEQEIILTVPASFDEIARSLTVEAAKKAGFSHLTLLEEPQAAFYHWLMEHSSNWTALVKEGEGILVCDVGGGTTDFSWIEVRKKGENIGFERTAVGEHLLLGGDNMDAAIAHYLEENVLLEKDSLTSSQVQELKYQACLAKEKLLTSSSETSFSAWISGDGSQVIGGGKKIEIQKKEIEELLLKGFFDLYSFSEAISLNRGSGLRAMGLPYEREPSITKHLAHFLFKNGISRKPAHVLFNGGAMKPKQFQKRILDSLELWFPNSLEKSHLLTSSNAAALDVSVAKGSAYFGWVRRGFGTRIEGGSSRGYYLEIDVKNAKGEYERSALTLIPKGSPEGVHYVSDHLFSLLPNAPVSFKIYHSHTRRGDAKGTLVSIKEEEMALLPPLHTLLRFGNKHESRIPVHLGIHLTEIGILELWIESKQTSHRWNLEFQLRSSSQGEQCLTHDVKVLEETFDVSLLEEAKKILNESFSVGNSEKLLNIMGLLENALHLPRQKWPMGILRKLFDALLNHSSKCDISSFYESKWWNLAGFFLRPGKGFPLDDFRVKEIWKKILIDAKKAKPEEVQIQEWICLRRIAGGLNKGQHTQLFSKLLSEVTSSKANKKDYAFSEKMRALGSFELVDSSLKHKLGQFLIKRIQERKANPAEYWTLGRLGARRLLWGNAANVISRDMCAEWIEQLLNVKGAHLEHLGFLLFLLSQKTDLREINLSDSIQEKVSKFLLTFPEEEKFKEYAKGTDSSWHQHQERIFGDSLPPGLIVESVENLTIS